MSNIKSSKNLKNVKSGLLFGPFRLNYFAFEIVYQFAKKNYPVPAAFLVDSSLTVETLEAETLASKLFQTPLRLTSSEMLISGMSLATGILTTLPLARIRNEPYERKRRQTNTKVCFVSTLDDYLSSNITVWKFQKCTLSHRFYLKIT